ncbi:hypothetical protein Pfo_012700 [Paulownia fortunei]|nr:hypothetical protein Pfo_012700 [Paulownia fortunei]
MEATSQVFQIQHQAFGKLIRILSIDGGGIRGIIQELFLIFLNQNFRIADYFDVIAGTSTGGLVTAMLTAPNENDRPLFAAKDIKDFYLHHCPKIFPPESGNLLSHAARMIKSLSGPKYGGEYLHSLLKEKLGDAKLHQTLTNIVIPTFYIKKLQPTIFSSYETLIAIEQILKEMITQQSSNLFPQDPKEHGRFLVLSLGTGSPEVKENYNAKAATKWGVLRWLISSGSTPLLDVLSRASTDMADYHNPTVLQALHSQQNYLRIQNDALTGVMSSVDVATKENLEDLVKVGERLLKRPVSRVNLETGIYVPSSQGTNEEALIRLAAILSKEKRLRDAALPTNHSN